MQTELEIWGRRTSSNVQALMWCVGELGLPYRRHDIGHIHGGTETEAFGALNPNRTVPVLRDGEVTIWETGAVLRYLAARYGDGAFWPHTPEARAQVDQWAEWAKINIALGFTGPLFWRAVRTAEADRDPVAIERAHGALIQKLAIAEGQLAGRCYLTGEALTLADIQFGHILFRYFDIELDRPALPEIRRYYAQLCARAAFQEHVMVSYESLRGNLP